MSREFLLQKEITYNTSEDTLEDKMCVKNFFTTQVLLYKLPQQIVCCVVTVAYWGIGG